MAFDITPYVDMSPKKVRELIRKGVIDFPTAGMCRGYAQANLVILPPEYAADFEEFAHRNVPWLCTGKYGCRHQQYDCQHQHCQE